MRTQQEAIEIYSQLRLNQKEKLVCFEGQRFFRFGASWRRISPNKTKEVVLNDGESILRVFNMWCL